MDGKVRGDKRYYGQGIGIALLDQLHSQPLIPGDVGNASTYGFPVRLKVIEGLHDNPYAPVRDAQGRYTPDVQRTVDAVKELEADGVRAVVMSCGFFSVVQEVLADEVGIPVFSSPLLLEGSDLPPFAADIQEATGKPVFDFITFANAVHQAVVQRRYCGFL